MPTTLTILHWHPLELYPPVMNMLNYLGDRDDLCVQAVTTDNGRGIPEFSHPAVKLNRVPFPNQKLGRIRRLWSYVRFQLIGLWQLIRQRPDVILYIEPHSSFPAYLYRWLTRKHRLLVHYHEYYEPKHFHASGMRLISFFHAFERRSLYPNAQWISQTNVKRLELFQQDHPGLAEGALRVLPNYPPKSWAEDRAPWSDAGSPIRLVYIGALSAEDTFLEELINWVSHHNGRLTVDLFSNNVAESAVDLLKTAPEFVTHHPDPIPYAELPSVLREYHIGLILYKATTINYKYNESNKLFEYLICGLDVVFPDTMLGVKPHSNDQSAPRVIEADFEQLQSIDLNHLGSRGGLPKTRVHKHCESEFRRLYQAMESADQQAKAPST